MIAKIKKFFCLFISNFDVRRNRTHTVLTWVHFVHNSQGKCLYRRTYWMRFNLLLLLWLRISTELCGHMYTYNHWNSDGSENIKKWTRRNKHEIKIKMHTNTSIKNGLNAANISHFNSLKSHEILKKLACIRKKVMSQKLRSLLHWIDYFGILFFETKYDSVKLNSRINLFYLPKVSAFKYSNYFLCFKIIFISSSPNKHHFGIKRWKSSKKYVIKWLPLLFEGETCPVRFFLFNLVYTIQTQVQNASL